MSRTDLPTCYEASEVEKKWYARWEGAGLFQPDPDPSKPVYSITIPPPNITGSLHMGHVLVYSLQDLLGRYHRLLGKSVLILPGQDHAGIATQGVVEKQLRKEESSGAQLGREKFVERVWQWRRESGDTILGQFRRLGHAFDWSRLRFTLDDEYSTAVLKVFIDWFDRGLIFKGKRVVNWDPALRTSVSDIETERRTVRGKLYYIKYPFVGEPRHVVIATTRPETMLADVAVAVHPSDQRYRGLIGKMLLLPLMNREIPLIEDIYPDPNFGSGAVKITPAHDPNDYQVGVRHGLPMPVLLDEAGHITKEGGVYAGLERLEARKRIVADLEDLGFIEKIEDYDVPMLFSERSGIAIEPLLSEQWFADQSALAKPAIEAVREDRVTFTPDRYKRIYLDWMENIREWCLSRQLWWGHRIPIYYDSEGTAYAALNWEEAQRKAGDKGIVSQEEDVLDTWFSSALWPFATLGWPDETPDLERYYPTNALITDRNILYLWVARMIMDGLDCMHEVPFKDVYIHATVLTEDGRRMSKSLGTGVDPGEVIDKYGADALRHTILSQAGYNQDIRFSDRRVEDSRNFCNKIWNAVRFTLMNAEHMPNKPSSMHATDIWLLSRLHDTEKTVRGAFNAYDAQLASQALHRFFWSELCDWYIEVSKKRLLEPSLRSAPQWVLLTCLEAFVKMLHPIMPHVTEEVYSVLPNPDKAPYLMASSWPIVPDEYSDPRVEAEVERAFSMTRSLRALRAELGLTPGKQTPAAFYEGSLDGAADIVSSQAWFEELRPGRPTGQFISVTSEGVDFHLPVEGVVDVEKELARLIREEERLAKDLRQSELRLANPQFIERAKPEVVASQRDAMEVLKANLEKIRERKKLFSN